MPNIYDAIIMADTPAAYWRLDEASGNFADLSGNGNTGVVSGTAFTYGIAGAFTDGSSKAVFATATSLATVAPNASLPNANTFSVEFWFQRSTTQNIIQYYMLQKPSGFTVQMNGSNLLTCSVNGGANFYQYSTAITDITSWHHFVITKNGAARAGYVDGVQTSNPFGNQNIAPSDTTLYLMANSAAASGATQSIDNIAVYTYALSATQVLAHYQAGGIMNCNICNRPMQLVNAISNLYYCYYCAYQVYVQPNYLNPGGPVVSVQVMNGEP